MTIVFIPQNQPNSDSFEITIRFALYQTTIPSSVSNVQVALYCHNRPFHVQKALPCISASTCFQHASLFPQVFTRLSFAAKPSKCHLLWLRSWESSALCL